MAWKDIGDWKWNDIVFRNEGREYKITLRESNDGDKTASIGGGNRPYLRESELSNVEVIEEKGLIFKKFFLVMTFNHWTFNGTEIKDEKIAVTRAELKNAELVVSFLKEMMQQRDERDRIQKEKQEKAKQERQNYIDSLRALDKSKVICLDVETTGLDCGEDEILQLSIIDGNNEVLFNEYIKPRQRKRWPKAQEIHGISYQMVKDKPTIDEYIPLLNQIMENTELIVGYNIDGFDIDFIREAGINVPGTVKTFDVMLEFAPIFGQWDDYHGDYKWQKLATCAKYYGYKKNGKFHDSLEDVRATLFCCFAMLDSNMQPK